MASFIIPSGVGDLVAPRTIYMDNGVQLSINTPKHKMSFGDGYKSIVHTGRPKRTASIAFTNRELEEISIIDTYFTYLAGSPIDDLIIFGEQWDAIVVTYNLIRANGEISGLNAAIKER